MIIDRHGVKDLVQAGDLKTGDVVITKDGTNQEIKEVKYMNKDTRYDLVTKGGTVLADGILASTMCNEMVAEAGSYEERLQMWRQNHEFT